MHSFPVLAVFGLVACGGAPATAKPPFQAKEPVSMVRLACGGPEELTSLEVFSDAHAFDGQKLALTGGCYLVQHGATYLLWIPASRSRRSRSRRIGLAPISCASSG